MRRARPGYTLLELICVLAIIIIAASISVPVYQTMITDMHISASADMVRARLADARSKAMDQCRPWRMSFLPSTGVFQLAPDEDDVWTDVSRNPTEKEDLLRDELPREIIFGQNAGDISGGKEGGTPGSQWQTICVFMPDGHCLDDAAVYFGKPGITPMRIRVRSLTGAVAVESAIIVKEGQ